MKTPEFWQSKGFVSTALLPSSAAWNLAQQLRRAAAKPQRPVLPVLCIGNVTAGGAGKTPVSLAIQTLLAEQGRQPHFISRGYGGKPQADPLRVQQHHAAYEVGDEPLLLARQAPCWVCTDRPTAIAAAATAGADCTILDDGFQNPNFIKDRSLLVIDGRYGLGNGRVMPAGPLREPLEQALRRADGVVLVGSDKHGLAERIGDRLPVFRGRLQPVSDPVWLRRGHYLAFAGIGRPAKFFAMLDKLGTTLVGRESFADHYPYTEDDMHRLVEYAQRLSAKLLTTEKDMVRIPAPYRDKVKVFAVQFRFDDPEAVKAWLKRSLP